MYDANFNVEMGLNCICSSRERTRLADTVPDSPNKLSRFVVVIMMMTKRMMRMTKRIMRGTVMRSFLDQVS